MISVLLKKILIKYKIIYAALFLLVVFCVYLSCKGNYSISVKGVEKKYEVTFDSLFAGYEGKWTAQKEARLEQMTDKQDALDEQFSQLSYDLLNKKITEDKLYQFVPGAQRTWHRIRCLLQGTSFKSGLCSGKSGQTISDENRWMVVLFYG